MAIVPGSQRSYRIVFDSDGEVEEDRRPAGGSVNFRLGIQKSDDEEPREPYTAPSESSVRFDLGLSASDGCHDYAGWQRINVDKEKGEGLFLLPSTGDGDKKPDDAETADESEDDAPKPTARSTGRPPRKLARHDSSESECESPSAPTGNFTSMFANLDDD